MSESATLNVTVLWADELRAAGMALEALWRTVEQSPEGEHSDLVNQALQTCRAALYHVGQEKNPLVICEGTRAKWCFQSTKVRNGKAVKE